MNSMKDYIGQLKWTLNAIWAGGGKVQELVVEEVASKAEIAEAEHGLKHALPKEFRQALLTVSSRVSFKCSFPSDSPRPASLKSVSSGQLEWGIEQVFESEGERILWVQKCFSNRDDLYDRVWHEKLAFQKVGNGDFLAFDITDANYGKVVYLSHDDGRGHGYVLGDDFMDFLDRWILLGCPGPDDRQWLPFTADRNSGIDPECPNAREWKRILFGELGE